MRGNFFPQHASALTTASIELSYSKRRLVLLVEDDFLAGDDVDAFSLRLGLLAPEQVVAFVIHPAAVYRFSAGGRLYGANARDEVVRTIIYIDGRGGESERQRRIDVDGRAGSKAAEGSLAEGVDQGEAGVDVIRYLEPTGCGGRAWLFRRSRLPSHRRWPCCRPTGCRPPSAHRAGRPPAPSASGCSRPGRPKACRP